MRGLIVAGLAALLCGCASMTPEQKAASASDFDVCYWSATLGASPVQAAMTAEIQRRSLDCRPYVPLFATRMAQEAQERAIMIQNVTKSLQQMTYRPPIPVAPQINCTTRATSSTTSQTTCN